MEMLFFARILRKKWKFLFWMALVLPWTSQARICVLGMFVPDSGEARMVRNVFQFYRPADLFLPAQISDVLRCFQDDQYEEILWLAHGASRNDGVSDYSTPILVTSQGGKVPLTKTFFQRRLAPLLGRKSLQKVRLTFCNVNYENHETSEEINLLPKDASTADAFVRRLQSLGVRVDMAPEEKWASSLFGWMGSRDRVAVLRYQWLTESLDRSLFTKWATNGNGWCESDRWPHCDRSEALYAYPIAD